MAQKHILIAVRSEDAAYAASLLAPDFDFFFCHTLKDAQDRLTADVGLIFCGVHFDQGRMFDFLRFAKSTPETRSIPFVLLLKEGTNYSLAMVNGVRSAAHLLGANSFIDIDELVSNMDRQRAYRKLRDDLRQLLLPSA